MSLRKPLFILSLVTLVLCLTAGFGIAGKWIGVLAAILMAPAWLFTRKNTDPWLPFLCLLASVGLAVAGTLIGASPFLMILSSAVALAVWDLTCLDSALKHNSFGEQTRRYQNKHIQSLALALGLGLFGALLGRFINLRFPFIIVMLLIVLTLFALDRVWIYIKDGEITERE